MASSPVITSQPQFGIASIARNSWQTEKFDCCSDCKVCACGTFCFCCLGCKVAKDMGECCCCGSSVAMRTLYRTRYRIPGTLLCDCCTAVCCAPCSLCQLKRDINIRKELGIF
ncbi:placenta-specific gene 8 protein-like [Macrochelys suwanniensis]